MDHIQIQNWTEYQHYSQRNPPWIKLHNKLLDNYEYGRLQDASKLLLISLYLLASRTDNKIPFDLEWIRSKAMLKGKIDLKPLIDAEFITVIADCNQDASTELSTCLTQKSRDRVETETEERQIRTHGTFGNVKLSEDEFEKLKVQFGEGSAQERIERLSAYIASKGKKYKSHYATILNWAQKDGGGVVNGKRKDDPGHVNFFHRPRIPDAGSSERNH